MAEERRQAAADQEEREHRLIAQIQAGHDDFQKLKVDADKAREEDRRRMLANAELREKEQIQEIE